MKDSSSSYHEEDVKSFLQKPRPLFNSSFGTGDAYATFATQAANIPGDILFQSIYANKIAGFYGLRATTVFTIVVNATRFQQGRYMFCFTSTAGANGTTTGGAAWITAHNNTLVQRTQLPRVEIDLNCDSQAVLKVPFVSAYNMWPIHSSTGQFSIGQVQMFPYSPLNAPIGSQTASFTVYVHFEDIELFGPAAPQSGTTTREQNSQKVGPVQSVTANIARAANIWKPVPVLSAVASQVSWVADALSRTAAVFGWSKPLNAGAVCRVNRVPGAYSGTVDNTDTALPVSLSVKNEVEVFPGFSGTDVDEMDFSYIASIPAYFNTLTWTTGLTYGSALGTTIALLPSTFQSTRSLIGPSIMTDYAPVAYVSSFFNNWRGGFHFKFKFVKTEFHSGRLAFCFYPEPPGATPIITFLGSDYVHREIVDIREANIVEFTVPYVNIQPWLQVNNPMGYLQIWVVDPLVAPSTVASTVTILCEVSGAPDFEVAVPGSFTNRQMVYNAVPQCGEPCAIPQSGEVENDCRIVDGYIGNSSVTFDNYSNAAAAVGERISSFRTLLKSASWVGYSALGPTTPSATTVYQNISTLPFAIPITNNTSTTGFNSINGDLYSSIASCYGMSRGGVRVRYLLGGLTQSTTTAVPVVPAVFSATLSTAQATTGAVTDWSTANTIGIFNPNAMSNTVLHNFVDDKIIELQVPQYHTLHSRPNAIHIAGTGFPYNITAGAPTTNLQLTTYTKDRFASYILARSGADDLNFGQFISIPPLTANSGNFTGTNQF